MVTKCVTNSQQLQPRKLMFIPVGDMYTVKNTQYPQLQYKIYYKERTMNSKQKKMYATIILYFRCLSHFGSKAREALFLATGKGGGVADFFNICCLCIL